MQVQRSNNKMLGMILDHDSSSEEIAETLNVGLAFPFKFMLSHHWPENQLLKESPELLIASFDCLNGGCSNCDNLSLGSAKHLLVYNVPDDQQALKLLHKGVDGVFYQDCSIESIKEGCLKVLDGELWYPHHIFSQHVLDVRNNQKKPLDDNWHRLLSDFSRRELQVMALITQGEKNNDIAESLFISIHTVKSHVSGIFKKLQVKARSDVIAWANERQGILDSYLHKKND